MLPEFESWLGPYERANAYNSLWLSFLIGKKKKKKNPAPAGPPSEPPCENEMRGSVEHVWASALDVMWCVFAES